MNIFPCVSFSSIFFVVVIGIWCCQSVSVTEAGGFFVFCGVVVDFFFFDIPLCFYDTSVYNVNDFESLLLSLRKPLVTKYCDWASEYQIYSVQRI